MYRNYNKYRVLQALFDRPTTGLHLREIAKAAALAPMSTRRYLTELEKERLVRSGTERYGYPLYYAGTDTGMYKLLRQQNVVLRLEESGLLDELESHGPAWIILFGSASRGEDGEESDIDLYVEGKHRSLKLTSYEKRLRRRINVLFSDSFEKASNEFKNNIINAVLLRGYLQAYPNEPLPRSQARSATRAKPRSAGGRDARRVPKRRRE